MARHAVEHPVVRTRLLEAARQLMLRDGFPATGVAEICAAAGVTKGSFFHYFASKDAICTAALLSFGADLGAVFAAAPFHAEADPLARVEGYVDFTKEVCRSSVLRHGGLVGRLAQELGTCNPAVRERCHAVFAGWAESLADHLAVAKAVYAPDAAFDARSLAMHFVALVEGALILAKTSADPHVVEAQLDHFRVYVRCLLGQQALPREGLRP